MRPNRTKQRLAAGEIVLGCFLQQYGCEEVPRALARAGFDFLLIDSEHGVFDFATLLRLIRATLEAGATPLVRVPELAYAHVARALDGGAQGIMFPRAESAEVLRPALAWTRFPPLGVRGYGMAAPHLDYEPRSFTEVIEHVNTHTLVVVQFETALAIERREELLAMPGIDVALIGPADLSVSLGVPGEFEHPKLVEAGCALIETARRHGVAPGIQCRNVALAKRWIERGMRFVGAGTEHGFLFQQASQAISELSAARAAVDAPQPRD